MGVIMIISYSINNGKKRAFNSGNKKQLAEIGEENRPDDTIRVWTERHIECGHELIQDTPFIIETTVEKFLENKEWAIRSFKIFRNPERFSTGRMQKIKWFQLGRIVYTCLLYTSPSPRD